MNATVRILASASSHGTVVAVIGTADQPLVCHLNDRQIAVLTDDAHTAPYRRQGVGECWRTTVQRDAGLRWLDVVVVVAGQKWRSTLF